MNQGQGKQTGLFGEWLSNYLKNKPQHYVVYYDHGDRYKNPNVVAIKSFYGDKLSNQNQLAEVDIMVTRPNHDIVTIIEIEERESPPKKIIGDIIALLMCNHFSVRLNGKNQYFRITSGTKLIVAGFINPKGSKMAQLKEVILPRILQFTPLLEGINPKNLSIICEEDLETTMVKLREYMQGLFS